MRFLWMIFLGICFFFTLPVEADSIAVDGLGTFPFRSSVSVIEGRGIGADTFFHTCGERKGCRTSKIGTMRACFMAVPGMEIIPNGEPYPYDQFHLYQIKKSDIQGTYVGEVTVFSGTEDTFFQKAPSSLRKFWQRAFASGEERVHRLSLSYPRHAEEMEEYVNARMAKAGEHGHIEILSFSPWRAYLGGDGVRWSQEAKVIHYAVDGQAAALWMATSLFQKGDRYYLVTVTGTHGGCTHLSDDVLFAMHRLQREES